MMFPQKPDHGKVVDVPSNAVPKSPHSAHSQQHLEPSEAVGVGNTVDLHAFFTGNCVGQPHAGGSRKLPGLR